MPVLLRDRHRAPPLPLDALSGSRPAPRDALAALRALPGPSPLRFGFAATGGGGARRARQSHKPFITDGPFAETKEHASSR